MTDMDWENNAIHLIQGKTDIPLHIPVSKQVLTTVADHILHGRPKTSDCHIFVRHIAPYNGFHDGVSIACIFRKQLKKAGIEHVTGDGRTLHGIRRGLGYILIENMLAYKESLGFSRRTYEGWLRDSASYFTNPSFRLKYTFIDTKSINY